MTAQLIDGKAIAAALRARVAAEVRRLAQHHGLVPGIAVVLVGSDPASEVYVRSKANLVVEAGMRSFDHRLPGTTGEAELLALVGRLNADPAVHGILVQLPLPAQIDARKVIEAVDPAKDVDGFHPLNAGRLAIGLSALVPCTPRACVMLAKTVRPSLAGLDAVVVGRSNVVGRPLAQLHGRTRTDGALRHDGQRCRCQQQGKDDGEYKTSLIHRRSFIDFGKKLIKSNFLPQ